MVLVLISSSKPKQISCQKAITQVWKQKHVPTVKVHNCQWLDVTVAMLVVFSGPIFLSLDKTLWKQNSDKLFALISLRVWARKYYFQEQCVLINLIAGYTACLAYEWWSNGTPRSASLFLVKCVETDLSTFLSCE